MRTVVPFDPRNPNSRLSPVLDDDQRREFAAAMLADVLDAVRGAGGDPEVLATASPDIDVGVPVSVDDRSLSAAVQGEVDADLPVAVVMADLALATPESVRGLFDAGGDVALAPGAAGGTNGLVVREPGFSVDYHGASFRDHSAAAERAGLDVAVVDSFRLAVDVDDVADLVDVFVHGEGRARDWLVDAGFDLAVRDGEPVVEPNA
ncbi:2-phospho-L-lactate guanylyltransferase [Halobacterium jilantaiense]|uniref:2-phospho-L-lactate guanylyltransferase n=1 Tax=Halobacterium jilantaiense TaxID=355548 RepID=A0A1I0Q7S3_9EURY|nr:2-phospho-L-lactate guanylyltransferase [Halobacterium jilantaiense]SEW23039.1 phospholactate guanylyltransferase [Halobacterium jilantaiense]